MKISVRNLTLFALLATLSFAVFAEDKKPTITFTTNAFLDEGSIPVLYTCDGKDVSPQLSWSTLPEKTKAIAIILADPDAPKGPFYHWVSYNIPTSATTIPEGGPIPKQALLGTNSFGKTAYNGPCPPKGTAHSYIFTLYALDAKLTIPAGADGKTVLSALKSHTLDKAILTAVYSRWIN